MTVISGFTAIDFETANHRRASVCAVGAVKVRDGRIVDEYSTLIRPPAGLDEFGVFEQRVHGIAPEQVLDAPSWPSVLPHLMDLAGSDVLVAHNAEFESSVLREASHAHQLAAPCNKILCTKILSKQALSLSSYTLPAVARHLGVASFTHHDPLADARATAFVMLAIASREGITSLDGAESRAATSATSYGHLPDYVLEQAYAASGHKTYNSWLRACLAHPNGRAEGGEDCVMCGASIDRSLHWQLREHRVCGDRCNASLKRAFKKACRLHGIRPPH